MGILRGIEGGVSMREVLARRLSYFGFEDSEVLAERLVDNLSCIAEFVAPFVLTAVVKSVCNAWPTARRFGFAHSSHCMFGCYSVGGDDILHYPFCPYVLEFINEECNGFFSLWTRLGSLGHFFLLHSVNVEDLVRTAIFNDLMFQAINARRNNVGVGSGKGALYTRFRSVCIKIHLARRLLLGELHLERGRRRRIAP
jgi:hypothetical protein